MEAKSPFPLCVLGTKVFRVAAVPPRLSPYRSRMGQPEVLPFMNRAKAIDATYVEFIEENSGCPRVRLRDQQRPSRTK